MRGRCSLGSWLCSCVSGIKKRVLLPSIYLSPREIVVGLSAGTRGRTLDFFLSFGRFGSRDDFVFVYLAFGGIGVSTALSGWG